MGGGGVQARRLARLCRPPCGCLASNSFPPLPSPAVDALENAAILATLYLEGALAPDCPLVSFAHAGDMAQARGFYRPAARWRRQACRRAALQCGGDALGLAAGDAAPATRRGGAPRSAVPLRQPPKTPARRRRCATPL